MRHYARVNRLPINSNNDDNHYEALVNKQTKNYDTFRNYASFSKGYTAVAQHEDGEQWTPGTVVRRGDHNHNNRSYMICITKTGLIVTKNKKYIKATSITAEQYFWDQLSTDTVDMLDHILNTLNMTHPHNKQIKVCYAIIESTPIGLKQPLVASQSLTGGLDKLSQHAVTQS